MEVRVLSQSQVQETLIYEDKSDFILIKDRILLSPGNWNGLEFSKEEISKAFQKTDWSNKQNYALIYDHDERATNWLGNVTNIRILEDGSLIGDLQCYDREAGLKLTKGGAKLGISAKVLGIENDKGEFVDFTFNNFSVVYEPACKKAYINLSQDKDLAKQIMNKINELVSLMNQVELEKDIVDPGEKIKYGKKKKKEELGPKFEEAIKKIKDSLRKQYPKWDEEKITSTAYAIATKRKIPRNLEEELDDKDLDEINDDFTDDDFEDDEVELSNLKDLKGGNDSVTMSEEKEEQAQPVETTEAEVKEEVKETEQPVEAKESEELSSKLDKVLALLESFDKRIAKLEEEPKAEEAKEEAPKVEEKLSEKAEPKVMSVAKLDSKRNALSGANYSPGEMRLAEVLRQNAERY